MSICPVISTSSPRGSSESTQAHSSCWTLPLISTDAALVPYKLFTGKGVYVKSFPTVRNVPLGLLAIAAAPDRPHSPTPSSNNTISAQQAWLIGAEGSKWIEPADPALSINTDHSTPDQERLNLVNAAVSFAASRSKAFRFRRTRRMFEQLRDAFGLYQDSPFSPFVDRTEDCVRGFLATSRTQVEGAWDCDQAIQLADITAAFMAYILAQGVSRRSTAIQAALSIAQRAGNALATAEALEQRLTDPVTFNAAAWAAWGGQYAARDGDGGQDVWTTCGSTSERVSNQSIAVLEDGLCQISYAQHIPSHQAMSYSVEDHVPLDYIPFERRIIISVAPPALTGSGSSSSSRLTELVTAPAPWTCSEAWRRRNAYSIEPHMLQGPKDFDKEESHIQATHQQISIWADTAQLPLDALPGMGIRARWRQVQGQGNGATFWTVQIKDYVLPAFWTSSINA